MQGERSIYLPGWNDFRYESIIDRSRILFTTFFHEFNFHSTALVASFTQLVHTPSTHFSKNHHSLPTSNKMKSFTTIVLLSIAALSSAAVLPRQANSQSFTGAIGGIAATPVQNSGNADRPFQVKGDTFVNLGAALQRSCDQQFNACANAANGGNAAFSTAQCTAQKSEFCGLDGDRCGC